MKNNTSEAKIALQRALSLVPQDNALTEVRYHLKVALDKLENVENKREKREISAEKRQAAVRNQVNPFAYDPLRYIQAIDEEIAKEKMKIEEIQQRRREKEKGDNDEFSTIFG